MQQQIQRPAPVGVEVSFPAKPEAICHFVSLFGYLVRCKKGNVPEKQYVVVADPDPKNLGHFAVISFERFRTHYRGSGQWVYTVLTKSNEEPKEGAENANSRA